MLGNVDVLSENGEEACEEERFGSERRKILLFITSSDLFKVFSFGLIEFFLDS